MIAQWHTVVHALSGSQLVLVGCLWCSPPTPTPTPKLCWMTVALPGAQGYARQARECQPAGRIALPTPPAYAPDESLVRSASSDSVAASCGTECSDNWRRDHTSTTPWPVPQHLATIKPRPRRGYP